MKIQKRNKNHGLKQSILILIMMIFITSSIISFKPVAATPGVGGTPPDVTELDYNLDTRAVQYGSDTYYYGVYLETEYNFFLDGPNVNTLNLNLFNKEYIESEDLTVQKIVAWRPIFLIESEPWYSHTFDYAESASEKTSITFTTGISIGDDSFGISLEDGSTTTTISDSSNGWSETASNGDTKVVYVRMEFLRVTGSVTYNKYLGWFRWKTVTHNYDITILEDINMGNIDVVTNPSTDLPKTNSQYFEPRVNSYEKHYYLDNAWYSNSEVSEISDYFKFSINFCGATFSCSVDVTSSTSQEIKHNFVGNFPSSYNYFYYMVDNYFSLNIVSIYSSGGGGGGGFVPM